MPRPLPVCRPSPTIPAWKSTRCTAHRAFIRHGTPGPALERRREQRKTAARAWRTLPDAAAHGAVSLCDGVPALAGRSGPRSSPRRTGRERSRASPRGDGGFGYDPLFVVAGDDANGRATAARAEKPDRATAARPCAAWSRRSRRQAAVIDPRDVPLALYVHLPWCVRKCPYCDFNSHAVPGGRPAGACLSARLAAGSRVRGAGGAGPGDRFGFLRRRHAEPVFGELDRGAPAQGARTFSRVAANVEVTLEANPGTIERGRFTDYAAAGVNRVSLGAQSFDDRKLELLGRIHVVRRHRPRGGGSRGGGRRQFQSRPDVRVARADGG